MHRIIREQDEQVCITCGRRWDIGTPTPQECKALDTNQSSKAPRVYHNDKSNAYRNIRG